jgi:hypothetical protein
MYKEDCRFNTFPGKYKTIRDYHSLTNFTSFIPQKSRKFIDKKKINGDFEVISFISVNAAFSNGFASITLVYLDWKIPKQNSSSKNFLIKINRTKKTLINS